MENSAKSSSATIIVGTAALAMIRTVAYQFVANQAGATVHHKENGHANSSGWAASRESDSAAMTVQIAAAATSDRIRTATRLIVLRASRSLLPGLH